MKWSGRIFLVFLAAIALGLVVFAAWRGWLHWRLATVEGELRAAGNPVSKAEMEAMLGVADAPTGATALGEALVRITGLYEDNPRWRNENIPFFNAPRGYVPGEPLGRSSLLYMERCLEAHEDALTLLHSGLAEPTHIDVVPLGAAVEPYRERQEALFNAARVLCLEALYSASTGDNERAVAAVLDLGRLEHVVDRQPQSGLHLTRLRSREMGAMALNHVLALAELDGPRLDRLSAAWNEDDSVACLHRFVQARFCEYLDTPAEWLVDVMSSASPRYFPDLNVNNTPAERWREFVYTPRLETYWLHQPSDRLVCLGLYQTLIELCAAPPESWHGRFGEAVLVLDDPPLGHYLSRIMESALGSALNAVEIDVVRTRMAMVALAAERYRVDHNTLPETMEDLVPAYLPKVPADLFRQGPIRYARDYDAGYTITAAPPSPRAEPVTFVVHRAPH